MKKDRLFETATTTKKGYAVKDVEWNGAAKAYLGMVKDPIWLTEKHPWVTCTWDRKGRCTNRTRTDCDLVLPETAAKK